MGKDDYIKQFRYQFLHNWHCRLSERSYFTRHFLFLMSITSVTVWNTLNSVSHSCTTSFDFTLNIFLNALQVPLCHGIVLYKSKYTYLFTYITLTTHYFDITRSRWRFSPPPRDRALVPLVIYLAGTSFREAERSMGCGSRGPKATVCSQWCALAISSSAAPACRSLSHASAAAAPRTTSDVDVALLRRRDLPNCTTDRPRWPPPNSRETA